MGRAIVRDPQVFLFDEPLSNLDAKLRVAMRAEIKELHQRLKTTTVYVTHDQIEAMTMADKIVVMHDGIVEQIGAPLDLYDRPANLFVAGFIGSPAMNMLTGRASTATAASSPATAALRCRWQRAGGSDGRAGRLRHPARASMHLGERRLPLEVVVVEPTGSETQVLAHARRRPRSSASSASAIASQPGETIRVRADPRARRTSSTPRPARASA